MTSCHPLRLTILLIALLGVFPIAAGQEADWKAQVDELVAQLDADTAAERDLAETNLLGLAEAEGIEIAELLEALPEPNDNMPPIVIQRLTTIRRTLEARLAREATAGGTIKLEAINWKLSDVLKELQQQSGNQIVDARAEFGEEATDPEIILTAEGTSFWEAVDQVLDQAKLSVNDYAGDSVLSLIARQPGEANRYGRADYSGPFRFEVVEIAATRGLRNPANQRLLVDLEIAWEPRLRPIAMALPVDMLEAVDEENHVIENPQPGRVFYIEPQQGSCTTTLSIPFKLPPRNVGAIARLRGSLAALVPGKIHEFRFEDLQPKEPVTQTVGGVHVTLDKVVKNNDIWEVHMRLKLDDDNEALASHRGWVFNNLNFLVGADGEPIDHAGFETTLQTEREVGIAYFFDLPDGLDGLTWVYKSPVAIVEQQYEFELSTIELP